MVNGAQNLEHGGFSSSSSFFFFSSTHSLSQSVTPSLSPMVYIWCYTWTRLLTASASTLELFPLAPWTTTWTSEPARSNQMTTVLSQEWSHLPILCHALLLHLTSYILVATIGGKIVYFRFQFQFSVVHGPTSRYKRKATRALQSRSLAALSANQVRINSFHILLLAFVYTVWGLCHSCSVSSHSRLLLILRGPVVCAHSHLLVLCL